MKLDANNISRAREIIQAYDAYDTIDRIISEYFISKVLLKYKDSPHKSDDAYELAYKTLENIVEHLHMIYSESISIFDKKLAENLEASEIVSAIEKDINDCAEKCSAIITEVKQYSDYAASLISSIKTRLSVKNISESEPLIDQLFLRLQATYLHEAWYDEGKGDEIRNLCDKIVVHLDEYFLIVQNNIVMECKSALEISEE